MINYNEIWEEICYEINEHKNSSENELQIIIENLFAKLGWKKRNGEVVRPTINFGASNFGVPDIVLKKDNKYQLCIEIKKYFVGINERHKEQLFSYMRELRIEFGLLWGNTIQLFYDDNRKSKIIKICDINFDEKNNVGIELTKLLAKDNFTISNLKLFCDKQLELYSKENEINVYISYLCSLKGSEYIKELLLMNYSKEVVDKINISITKKDNSNERRSYNTSHNLGPKFVIQKNEKVQDWIKRVLEYLYYNNMISDDEIKRLQDLDYCKKTFDISYPLFCDNERDILIKNHYRYWTNWKLDKYYVCSQWWKQKTEIYIDLFNNWLNIISKS